jgi:hypothetical protein
VKRRAPEVIDSGNIVSLPPLLLSVKEAARYCGCSASLLNSYRAEDTKRLNRGEKILGPAWVLAPFGIRYMPAALTEWVKTGVPLGVMDSRRRPPRDPSDPSSEPTAA